VVAPNEPLEQTAAVMLGITLPFAIIYLICATVAIEEEIDNPTEFLEAFRAGKVGRR
jgi:hypothetical protein